TRRNRARMRVAVGAEAFVICAGVAGAVEHHSAGVVYDFQPEAVVQGIAAHRDRVAARLGLSAFCFPHRLPFGLRRQIRQHRARGLRDEAGRNHEVPVEPFRADIRLDHRAHLLPRYGPLTACASTTAWPGLLSGLVMAAARLLSAHSHARCACISNSRRLACTRFSWLLTALLSTKAA